MLHIAFDMTCFICISYHVLHIHFILHISYTCFWQALSDDETLSGSSAERDLLVAAVAKSIRSGDEVGMYAHKHLYVYI